MYFEEMSLGQSLELPHVTIDRQKVLDFSHEYDPFPLHHDEAYAAATRYGRLVAPGVMTFMSMWAQVHHAGFFGPELVAGKSTYIEWFAPVFPGDTLHGQLSVTALTKRNPYNGIVETTMHVFNSDGKEVLKNVTESVVACRPAT